MPENKDPLSPGSDAEFLGWQKTSTGEAIALYNVTAAQHPLFQSTVSEKREPGGSSAAARARTSGED